MGSIRSFFAFWYDFLVGDRPELFAGTLGVLLLAWVLVGAGVAPALAGLVMVGSVLGVLAASLWRAVGR
jgi:hypothetical protein